MKLELPPDPLSVLRPLVEGVGGADQADRVRRGMQLLATLPRPPVGTTPHEVIHRQNKLVVRYYAPASAAVSGRSPTPVIVVPSMINRAYICDLEPDRSLVGGLAALGHAVYLVDWGEPGPEDAHDDVAKVLLDLLHRAVDRVRRHARGARRGPLPAAHLLGYCQGGTLAAMYTALRPDGVAGLVTLNAPVKFSEGGRFRRFVDGDFFDVEEAIDADGLVSTDLMAAAFKLLDPMGNWTKYIAIDAAAQRPGLLARTLARERWLEENVPMAGAFAREFIREAYQQDALLAGTWQVGGERVDLSRVTCPTMVCTAKRDFIAPSAACLPLAGAVGSRDVTLQQLDSGHIGVVVGSFGPRVFYPLLDGWFRSRNPART
ncbi:MAG: alpha/beta fold hydrolase [Alphaproteobacteria bacterium]|nr:alpha/beta fold hydrolase [Alphaproteobacteria bacterium]